jgi:hypothetical protein
VQHIETPAVGVSQIELLLKRPQRPRAHDCDLDGLTGLLHALQDIREYAIAIRALQGGARTWLGSR